MVPDAKQRRAIVGVVTMLFVAVPVFAQSVSPNTIVGDFQAATAGWYSAVYGFAMRLFLLLAAIQVAWAAAVLVLERSDLQGWTAGLIKQIMWIGIFYALLVYGSTWVPAIVNSFIRIGQSASGVTSLQPSDIFGIGVDLGTSIIGNVGATDFMRNPGVAFWLVLSGLGTIVCFSLIAVQLVMALVESFIVISGGIIFLGFGGSKWTATYVERYLGLVVNVGVKLFVIYLLIGIAVNISSQWIVLAANVGSTDGGARAAGEILGAALILLALIWQTPKMIATMIGGSPQFSGGDLVSTTAGVGTALGTAAGVAGMGAAAAAGAAGGLAGGNVMSPGQAANFTAGGRSGGGGGGGGGSSNPAVVGGASWEAGAPVRAAAPAPAGGPVSAQRGESSQQEGPTGAQSADQGRAAGEGRGAATASPSMASGGQSGAASASSAAARVPPPSLSGQGGRAPGNADTPPAEATGDGGALRDASMSASLNSIGSLSSPQTVDAPTTNTAPMSAGAAGSVPQQTPPGDKPGGFAAGSAGGVHAAAQSAGGVGPTAAPGVAGLSSPQTISSPGTVTAPVSSGGGGTTPSAGQAADGPTYRDDMARSAAESSTRAPNPDSSVGYRDDMARSAREAGTRSKVPPPLRGSMDTALQKTRQGLDALSRDGGGAPPGATPRIGNPDD